MKETGTKEIKKFVILATLIAIEIILSRFLSITARETKYSLGFVAVMIAAMLYGPIAGGIVGGMADLLGALLFPVGPYFAGFTLTAVLTGVVFGLLLHKKPGLIKLIAAVVINQLIFALLLNTFWIHVLYGSPFKALLLTRIVQCTVMIVVQTVVGFALIKALPRISREISK